MKILFTIFFCVSFIYLQASTVDISKLQNEFEKKVLEVNAFKKRYGSYLFKNCEDDFNCYEKYINLLKSWDSVQNDNSLKMFLETNKKTNSFDKKCWETLQNKLIEKKQKNNIKLSHTQFVNVIDLEKQLFILTLWDNSRQKFYYIGKDHISSGNMEREAEIRFGENHYLKTPNGIFKSQIGWRSDGKYKDDNRTLGYGYKDRFVFYFGKLKSVRYNTFDKNGSKIIDKESWKLITDELEFALHAHKSSAKLGKPYSHGCVRMSDELNRFLDNNHALHKSMFKDGMWRTNYTKIPKNPQNHNLSGEYLFIFDKIQ